MRVFLFLILILPAVALAETQVTNSGSYTVEFMEENFVNQVGATIAIQNIIPSYNEIYPVMQSSTTFSVDSVYLSLEPQNSVHTWALYQ